VNDREEKFSRVEKHNQFRNNFDGIKGFTPPSNGIIETAMNKLKTRGKQLKRKEIRKGEREQ
jgi:hypothetical protein